MAMRRKRHEDAIASASLRLRGVRWTKTWFRCHKKADCARRASQIGVEFPWRPRHEETAPNL